MRQAHLCKLCSCQRDVCVYVVYMDCEMNEGPEIFRIKHNNGICIDRCRHATTPNETKGSLANHSSENDVVTETLAGLYVQACGRAPVVCTAAAQRTAAIV